MPRDPLLRKSSTRIGELLVQRGFLTADGLKLALDAQKRKPSRRLGDILREDGLVTEEQLAQALADQYGLTFIDLQRLPAGWTLDRELYNFKLKHLKILPMRDPQGQVWYLLSEASADEKMMIPEDVDLTRIRFGVAPTTCLEQVLAENAASNEGVYPPIVQDLAFPQPASDPGTRDQMVPAFGVLDLERVLTIIGALFGQSRIEVERRAVLKLARGPRFRVEVHQIVPEPVDAVPPGYVQSVSSRVGRAAEISVRVPYTTRPGTPDPLGWPSVWPPPDLAETLTPFIASLCKVPAALRSRPDGLRWLGNATAARDRLNVETVQALGVSVGRERIDDTHELWDAMLARVRSLEALQAARVDWDRFKQISCAHLDILPGNVLGMAALATNTRPAELVKRIALEVEPSDVFAIELFREPKSAGADTGPLAGLTLRVSCPAAPQTKPGAT